MTQPRIEIFENRKIQTRAETLKKLEFPPKVLAFFINLDYEFGDSIEILPKTFGDSVDFPLKKFGDLDIVSYICDINQHFKLETMAEERIFKRKLYDKMVEWKQTSNGSTALLIQGARRVGKSTLAQEFARTQYKSHIVVDFSDAPDSLWSAVDNITNRDDFFMKLQFIYGVKLYERESVIIFDEIQMAPLVRQAIKHLVKDHRYDYIETGSLISIKKNTKDIVIPSEETRITLYPMDYEEFNWALGNNDRISLLRESFDKRLSVGDSTARHLLRDFRLYMLIGGMPQAVETYIETNNLSDVDRKKREIIELYLDDFKKIDSSGKISRMFKAIPAQLNNGATSFKKTTVVGSGLSSDTMAELLMDLEDSLTVNIAYHSNNPNVGLALHANYNKYKMFIGDTGLFITLAFWDNAETENTIYQKLLSDKLSADLGYVYENIVAQMLVASGHKLYYHTWQSETSNHKYEIDFLLSVKGKMWPIEVKSSGYCSHKSFDAFCEKYSNYISNRYIIYTKDLRKDGAITLLPVYLTMFL